MMEICRDLKRIAGLVNAYGWYPDELTGEEPVGGVVILSGPVLVYDKRLIMWGVPGYYSREEIDKAVEIMYGEN